MWTYTEFPILAPRPGAIQQPASSNAGCLMLNNQQDRNTAPTIGRQAVRSCAKPPQNTLLDMALPIRGTRHSCTYQGRVISPFEKEAYKKPWTNFTHQGEVNRSKKNYNTAPCRKKTTNNNLDKVRWQKNILQTKE